MVVDIVWLQPQGYGWEFTPASFGPSIKPSRSHPKFIDRCAKGSFVENLNPVEQHHAIVDAISKGDASGAVEAMRTHLCQILSDLPAMAELRPNYFENFDYQFNANVNCN